MTTWMNKFVTEIHSRSMLLNTTSVRNAALTDLDTWMRDLKVVARVALKDRPQLLDQIGVTV